MKKISYDRVFHKQIFWTPKMMFALRNAGQTEGRFVINQYSVSNQFISNIYDIFSSKNLGSMFTGLAYLSLVLYYTNVRPVNDQQSGQQYYLTNAENYKFWASLLTNCLLTPLLCRSILQLPVITTGLYSLSNCFLLNFYLFNKDRGTLKRNSRKSEDKINLVFFNEYRSYTFYLFN